MYQKLLRYIHIELTCFSQLMRNAVLLLLKLNFKFYRIYNFVYTLQSFLKFEIFIVKGISLKKNSTSFQK